MNPLLSVWRQPTKTLEYLLHEKTIAYGFFILFLGAVSNGVISMEGTDFLHSKSVIVIVLVSILISYAGALISWVISAAMYTWIGKWLGGTGNFSSMVRIVPAGTLPIIWLAPMNFLILAVYGSRLFEIPTENFGITNLPLGIYFLMNLILIAVGIYGTVVSCKGIGLVHQFSAWRGFGVVAIVMGIGIAIGLILAIVLSAVIFTSFGIPF